MAPSFLNFTNKWQITIAPHFPYPLFLVLGLFGSKYHHIISKDAPKQVDK